MSDTVMTIIILSSVAAVSVGILVTYLVLRKKNRDKIEQNIADGKKYLGNGKWE